VAGGKYGKYIVTQPLDPHTPEVEAFHAESQYQSNEGGIWLCDKLVADTKMSVMLSRWWDTPDPNPYIFAHKHAEDEILLWLPCGPHADLGTEVELYLGEEGEKHTFRGPTLVYIPGGLTHTPIVYKDTEQGKQWYNIAVVAKPTYP
jgi:hypothetical protein